MDWKVIVLVVAIMFGLLLAWIGRYEVVSVPAGGEGIKGSVYRLDRWTGNVTFMQELDGGQVRVQY